MRPAGKADRENKGATGGKADATINQTASAAILILLFFMITEVVANRPMVTNRFLLEYPSPVFGSKPTLEESIRVELFAVAQTINSTAMIYLPRPFETSSYVYNRWQVDPSHMVTDFLLRDLRNSRLFQGVFGYQQSGVGRFKVEGAVQQFAEVDDPDGWKAVLAVSVTLLDLNEAEVTKRVIMQKNYHQAEYHAGTECQRPGPGHEPGHGSGVRQYYQ